MGLNAAEVNLTENKSDRSERIMDTYCSFHMTPRNDYFLEFKEVNAGKVKMANGTFSEIKGIGSIRFTNPDGTTFLLQDVRYMPCISTNLIYIGNLESKGCEFKGGDGVLRVSKGCTVFMKGKRRAFLYILQAEARVHEAMSATSERLSSSGGQNLLWHSRLDHIV